MQQNHRIDAGGNPDHDGLFGKIQMVFVKKSDDF
jgi:hypothetical protein